jgi:DNA-directed RNA polymerase
MYGALNILGEQGWKINKDVLKTMNALWDSGGGVAGLPSRTVTALPDPPVRSRFFPVSEAGSDSVFSAQLCWHLMPLVCR